jgi:hypothetical protein
LTLQTKELQNELSQEFQLLCSFHFAGMIYSANPKSKVSPIQ